MTIPCFIFTVSLLILTAGCASTPTGQCHSSDWQLIGQKDGRLGNPIEHRVEHQLSCARSLSNDERATYEKGWTEGHTEFCSPAGGYRAGVRGETLRTTCDENEFPEFIEQYRMGIAVHQLQRQRADINRQINDINQDTSALTTLARAGAVLNGTSPTASLDERKALIEEKISAIDQNAPGGPMAASQQDLSPFFSQPSLMRKYLGIWAGGIFGFGIGQAIQGRYSESGWKWTLGEVATMGTMIAAASRACGDYTDTVVERQNGNSYYYSVDRVCQNNGPGAAYVPLTVLGWLGFRIWQTYDLFADHSATYADKKKARPTQALYASSNGVLWIYTY